MEVSRSTKEIDRSMCWLTNVNNPAFFSSRTLQTNPFCIRAEHLEIGRMESTVPVSHSPRLCWFHPLKCHFLLRVKAGILAAVFGRTACAGVAFCGFDSQLRA